MCDARIYLGFAAQLVGVEVSPETFAEIAVPERNGEKAVRAGRVEVIFRPRATCNATRCPDASAAAARRNDR